MLSVPAVLLVWTTLCSDWMGWHAPLSSARACEGVTFRRMLARMRMPRKRGRGDHGEGRGRLRRRGQLKGRQRPAAGASLGLRHRRRPWGGCRLRKRRAVSQHKQKLQIITLTIHRSPKSSPSQPPIACPSPVGHSNTFISCGASIENAETRSIHTFLPGSPARLPQRCAQRCPAALHNVPRWSGALPGRPDPAQQLASSPQHAAAARHPPRRTPGVG